MRHWSAHRLGDSGGVSPSQSITDVGYIRRQIVNQLIWIVAVFSVALFQGFGFAQDSSPANPESARLPLSQAVALGVIEGATEYLPISSTGHLLIYQYWMGMSTTSDETEAAHALAICIQLGAILAVVVLYFGRIKQMIQGVFGRDRKGLLLAVNLVFAFIPAAIIGIKFGDKIKEQLFEIRVVAAALFAGALIILALPHRKADQEVSPGKEMADLTWWQAFVIGTMQCLAFWPGFSRSLATILGCRLVGLKMAASVEFSFLLGLVTLSAATLKEGAKHGSAIVEVYGITFPLVALAVAFVSAVISVRFMVGILGRFGLAPFGYYRILLAMGCVILWWTRTGAVSAS